MDAIDTLFGAIWPGILGAVTTGLVIYALLREVARSSRHPVVLKWPAESYESTGTESSARSRRLER